MLLKWNFYRVLGGEFLLLTLVVILSSWYGGFGPGVLSAFILGIVNDFLFIPPQFVLVSPDKNIRTAIFILEGVFISTISQARTDAEEQKDEFIGFASHEIKTPLTVAKGYTEMIMKKTALIQKKQVFNYSLKIDECLNRVIALINDLLDITKINTGKFIYHDEYFNIYNLVEEVVKEQRIYAKKQKINLTGKSQTIILADKDRIGQVITNLIDNALKYSDKSKRVEIEIKDSFDGVVISIRDFGIGISRANQKKIFDLFFRITDSVEKQAAGVGIGLYISKQIIDRYHGKIWLKSTLGKGSTFYIFLPKHFNALMNKIF